VDDADDAIRWDDRLGWLVDVTITGGELDGEGPLACRVLSPFGAPGGGAFCPVVRGQPVAILIAFGNPNAGGAVIVGCLFADQDAQVPTEIVGETIDAALAKSAFLLRTDKNYLAQVGDRWHAKASDTATLEAPNLRLADADAGQSFVRGDEQKDALVNVLDALDVYLNAVQSIMTAAPFPKPGLSVAYGAWQASLAAAKTALASALSSKIKGS
jgi:hypothetical protein